MAIAPKNWNIYFVDKVFYPPPVSIEASVRRQYQSLPRSP